jgi:hypothetical protein
MLMIVPPPSALMMGMISRDKYHGPSMFTAITRRQSSSL